MSTGLVLGKFAPLHQGHQMLIDSALQENARVLVMIYHAPDVTAVPLPVRAGWIRQLYPQVEVIEAWDGPLEVGYTLALRRRHEDYLLARLGERRVDRFYSSERYGDHVSRALGAIDRRIDESRARLPISGSLIRAAPFQHRHFLDPLVYRDLIARVVLLGAPSTGKTTLAKALARQYRTAWMPEYGRDYWERHQQARRLTLEQLVELADGHREREDQLAAEADRFLFIDTDASTTRIFSHDYHGRALPRLDELVEESSRRYDLFILCADDIPFEDTWDRSGAASRTVLQEQTLADLSCRRIPYLTVTGALDRRIAQARRVLDRFVKYRSVLDLGLSIP